MLTFLSEFAFALAAILALGLAGGLAVLPFCERRRFVVLLAPMCGLLLLPIPTILIYSAIQISLLRATLITLTVLWVLTIASLMRWRPTPEDLVVSLVLTLPVAALAVWISEISAILEGAPSILFMHGTDQAGYAQLADWLLTHSATQPPALAPDRPYESWPNLMLNDDPRLGSFVLLAMTAAARGTSGLFAYDSACAIALVVAVLAVAAVYARTPLVLLLLTAALLTSVWFELGRAGYLGRVLGYPGALFIFGLLATSPKLSLWSVATLALFALSTATRHAGLATALILCAVGGPYVLLRGLFEYETSRHSRDTMDRLVALVLMVLLAFSSNGMFGLPRPFAALSGVTLAGVWTASILPRIFDVQSPYLDFATQPAFWIPTATALAAGSQFAIIIVAVVLRNAVAAALSGGTLLLTLLLYLADRGWIGAQLMGVIYPATLCSVGYVLDDASGISRRAALIGTLVVGTCAVGLRIPRVPGALNTYVFNTPPHARYAAKDFEALAAAIGAGVVHIGTAESHAALASLIEFGRRGMTIQWGPSAWNAIVGYRRWPVPRYGTRPEFCLIFRGDPDAPGKLVMSTPQFRLTRLSVLPVATGNAELRRGDSDEPCR